MNEEREIMLGGARIASSSHESLLDKVRNLHVPLGLVSRRYPSKLQHHAHEDCNAKLLDLNIFTELESMIFYNKKTGTQKNLKVDKHQKTFKKYLDK